MPAALAVLVLVLLPFVAGCGSDAPAMGERAGLGRSYFDAAGRHSGAGVSTRVRGRVEPYEPASFGADTLGREFHLFRARCSSCHEAPDPGVRSAEHWGFLLPRMVETSKRAGVLPMSQAEADSILALLQRNAGR